MTGQLSRLAEAHGIQTSYLDVDDRRQAAGEEALLAALRALGVDIPGSGEAGRLLEERRRAVWRRPLEPVVAAFDGRAVPVPLRLPAEHAERLVRLVLVHESGETHSWTEQPADAEETAAADVDGVAFTERRLHVRDVPWGYHVLRAELDGAAFETMLVVAPPQAYAPEGREREWGVFLPLYALRTGRDWGAGDLTDLDGLSEWVHELGGSIVGTLPILPVYLGGRTAAGGSEPFDPSPYNPVSRLFWNELICDLSRAAEVERCEEARRLLEQTASRLADLRGRRYVDWEAVAEAKGRVLRALAACFFDRTDDRRGDLERFTAQRPLADRYARFRGAVARHGSDWWGWPAGVEALEDGDVDTDTYRVHLYAQMLATEQVGAVSSRLRERGQHPYLDLPVGTGADGFDVFAFADLFATRAETGAPPDTIFTGGQNWRFPPLHPERVREDRYGYPLAVLRHHLGFADDLRIDHVMGLHRLFWIPEGVSAAEGVYVRYPADEWYAVLLLESHRHRSRIVGENLGTVPPIVEDSLKDRGIVRMYVVQYEADPGRDEVLEPVPADTVASLNTHDMPPFARWWTGGDAADGIDLGLADEQDAERARTERAAVRDRVVRLLTDTGLLEAGSGDEPAAVLDALLAWLGAGDAALVLAGLEDLWLETEPQNVPGTTDERPNWRRRAARTLDEVRADAGVTAILRRLDDERRKGRST